MVFKGKSLTSLLVILLLFRHAVVMANMSYQILRAEADLTIRVVNGTKNTLITQHSVNESKIAEKMTKWYFGVSDCWNYSMTEDQRLGDNYIRLQIFENQAWNISPNVSVRIGNLKRAINKMRKKLGYPHVNLTKHQHHSLPQVTPQEQDLLQVVFLSNVEKNLHLMVNDFHQRDIQTKA